MSRSKVPEEEIRKGKGSPQKGVDKKQSAFFECPFCRKSLENEELSILPSNLILKALIEGEPEEQKIDPDESIELELC